MTQPSFELVSPTFARDGAFTAITIFGTPTANLITSADEPSPLPPDAGGSRVGRILAQARIPIFGQPNLERDSRKSNPSAWTKGVSPVWFLARLEFPFFASRIWSGILASPIRTLRYVRPPSASKPLSIGATPIDPSFRHRCYLTDRSFSDCQ